MNNLPSSPFAISLDASSLFLLLFYSLMFAFVVQAIIVIYHWSTYGTGGKWQSIGIASHLIVGAVLFLGMLLLLP